LQKYTKFKNVIFTSFRYLFPVRGNMTFVDRELLMKKVCIFTDITGH